MTRSEDYIIWEVGEKLYVDTRLGSVVNDDNECFLVVDGVVDQPPGGEDPNFLLILKKVRDDD